MDFQESEAMVVVSKVQAVDMVIAEDGDDNMSQQTFCIKKK